MKKIKQLKMWWNHRHWRAIRKRILKLSASEQLGLAQSIISSIAVPCSRKHRRQFLDIQFARITEMAKDLVGDNKGKG